MTAEYIPAWIVGIADLLLVVIVVLGNHLSKSELKGVPRRLVNFIIAVSFIIGLMVFLNICLTLEEFTKYRKDSPPAAKESPLGVSEGAPSGLHHLASGPDHIAELVRMWRPGDLRFTNLLGRGAILSRPFQPCASIMKGKHHATP